MKTTKILYWVFTIPIMGMMLFSGIQNAMVTKASVDLLSTHLGYPVYLIAFLGVAKILGVIGALIPGYPRVTEWAYAGLFFDLVGALYSGIKTGDAAGGWVFMLLFIIVLALSYVFYHKKQHAMVTR
jgi:hypothetical protein